MPKNRLRRGVKQQQYRLIDDDDDDKAQVESPPNCGGILAALNHNVNNNANGNDIDDSESNLENNHTPTTAATLRGSRCNQGPRKSLGTSESDASFDATPCKNKNKKKPVPPKKNKNEFTPPPKSVVIGTLPCFSPPTHHPSQQRQRQQQYYEDDLQEDADEYQNENENESHSHHHHNDGVSALSCIVSPPTKTKRQQQQQQVPVHRSDDMWMSGRDPYSADCEPSDVESVSSGDSSSHDQDGESENDDRDDEDDKTIPMMEVGDIRDQDPDETFLEGDSLEGLEQVEEEDDEGEDSEDSHDGDDDEEDAEGNDELLSDPEDDDSSESEEEIDDDDEEEEEYTPDDDEFVPEDDEDLSTQDELEDVVDEKPLTRRGRQRKQVSPLLKPTKAKTGNKKVPVKKGQPKQPESPVPDHEMNMEAQSPMDHDTGMDTEVEVTPMVKPRNSRKTSGVEEEKKEETPVDQDTGMDTEVEVTPMVKPRNSRKASGAEEEKKEETQVDQDTGMDTEVEVTPMKASGVEEEKKEQTPVAPNRCLENTFKASSPESLVAVVCDDDDDDNDDDVDILEATILDDDAYSVAKTKSQEVSENDEEGEIVFIYDEDDQSYEADEETVAFGVDLDEESVAQSNPVDVSTSLDDEPVEVIEPVDEAVDETATMFAAVNLDHEPDEENEPIDVSVKPESEPIEENKLVDASLDLESEPVNETEESQSVDVSANLDTEPVDDNEPVDVSANLDTEPVDDNEPVDVSANLDTDPVDVSANLDTELVDDNEPVDVSANLDTEPVDDNETVDVSANLDTDPVDVSANLDTEPVDDNEPVDVSAHLDTEPFDDNESDDAAWDETVPKFVTVTMDNHAANKSEPIDDSDEPADDAVSGNVDASLDLDSEPVNETEESEPVHVSAHPDTEPVDDDESVDAAWDETVPKFVTVTRDNHAANESEPIGDTGESADDAVSENNENMVANDQDGSNRNADKGTPTKSTLKASKTSKHNKSHHRHEGIVKRGKWTLGIKLGVGSFGVVHMGMDTMTGTLMAVKTFQMERAVMKDIRREIELLRSLKHRNIVRYYGAEMDKKHLHVFQEWVPAGCVSSMLCRFGCFAMPVIRSYLSQTLSGLDYLHENHILHRDIKGSNLLVNDEGVVKLADFGASKRLANLQADLMMSMTVRGTPYFMAPEVFEEKYSSKADIWSVGCVAYQMATGSPPWKDQGLSNPISLFNYIKRQGGAPSMTYAGDAELLSEGEKHVRTLFEAFMEKCFHQDPSKRPTARALLEDPFFTELHHELDEDQTPCRGIFSPCSDTSTGGGSPSTDGAFSPPFLGSPSPTVQSQSRSVVQWKQSFRSPPKQSFKSPPPPKRKNIIGSPNPMRTALPRSPFRPSASKGSPSTDMSDWPTWARRRHLKLKKEQSTSQGTQNITELLDSLALSEDSNTAYGIGPNPFRRTSATNGKTTEGSTMHSNLDGVNLLDQSDITYEI
jgi:serine/threonine protein kinase